MPVINGEKIEHVIYDCNEVVHLYEDVYLKLIYVQRPDVAAHWPGQKRDIQKRIESGNEEPCIAVVACEADGALIEDGMICVLDDGIFYLIEGLNPRRLGFFSVDSKGRINIVR